MCRKSSAGLWFGLGQNQVASDGREEVDRQAISLEFEDLVKLVKKANPRTVLVLVSSFPYAIPWSKENVPAILHVTNRVRNWERRADVLFGIESPAGRLVQTWPKSIDQLPPMLDYNIRNGRTYMYDKQEPCSHLDTGSAIRHSNTETSGWTVRKSKTGKRRHFR